MRLGLYLPQLPQALSAIDLWESNLRWSVEWLSIYQAWQSPYSGFYSRELRAIHKTGRTALITWEPWELPVSGKPLQDQTKFSLKRILAGDYDDYIWTWAKASKSLALPYLLRPMHEMNGNWYPWCGTVNGNQPHEYVETWRYLHKIFQAAGATQVSWVWCPYAASFPQWHNNSILCYYPGDAYVDWIALDGYNWGYTQSGSRWQTFEELFSPGYENVTRLTDRPLLLAEIASAETGGNKSLWIRSAFEALIQSFDRVEGLVWFNTKKECDWRIDSSEDALLSFKEGLQSCSERKTGRTGLEVK
ncbi:MAG: glycoside hydrolase family 26 protein [Alphaproteobacteria bacterium]